MRTLSDSLAATVRDQLERALEASNGDRDATAARLGIARATLFRKLKLHPDLVQLYPGNRGRTPGIVEKTARKRKSTG